MPARPARLVHGDTTLTCVQAPKIVTLLVRRRWPWICAVAARTASWKRWRASSLSAASARCCVGSPVRAAGFNAIEIAVEIDLQQRRGMISRRPVCSGARRYRGIASRMKLGERVVSTRDIASPANSNRAENCLSRPARSTMDDKHVHICEPIWMRRIVIGEHRVNDDNPALGPHCPLGNFLAPCPPHDRSDPLGHVCVCYELYMIAVVNVIERQKIFVRGKLLIQNFTFLL